MIYSIGHGLKDVEYLNAIIEKYGIEHLVDVRTHPYSKHNPAVNRHNLEAHIACAYHWDGKRFGGLNNNIIDEDLLKLSEWSEGKTIMIMCSETDYHKCHRYYEISKRLKLLCGIDVVHILPDGNAETSLF